MLEAWAAGYLRSAERSRAPQTGTLTHLFIKDIFNSLPPNYIHSYIDFFQKRPKFARAWRAPLFFFSLLFLFSFFFAERSSGAAARGGIHQIPLARSRPGGFILAPAPRAPNRPVPAPASNPCGALCYNNSNNTSHINGSVKISKLPSALLYIFFYFLSDLRAATVLVTSTAETRSCPCTTQSATQLSQESRRAIARRVASMEQSHPPSTGRMVPWT